ncbi:uncharacterized protein LOC135334956 isoform X2 [Halichondria panicea]|uniref:uncharacterized protein LOC135334956 isoform X2 n=1 Tax=Halichondria panicea TaxID=6063 RepID=UPI00312BAD8B
MNNELLATRIMRMFPSRLFLCCLLGSAFLVYGQPLTRLASPTESSTTNHTGEIISFSDVGPKIDSDPSAWYCYTSDPGGVVWQFPDGSGVPIGNPNNPSTAAGDDELIITGVVGVGVALHRGPDHFSPDGKHCCVRISTTERKCVTFTPCPTLSPLSNGQILYNPGTDMATATYTCNTGYTVTGTISSIICNKGTREWSSTERPTCERLICPDIIIPANGVITYNPTTTPRDVGSMASYSCTTGYLMTGLAVRMCTVTGWSTGDDPVCTAICPDLPALVNGMIFYNPLSTPRLQGTVARHFCIVTGYQLSSSTTTRTCQSNRTWSGSSLICNPVFCGSPPTVPNGVMTSSTGTTFGAIATYSCNTGYQRSGSATITCQTSGSWSAAPVCRAICSNLSVLVNGIIVYNPTSTPRLQGAMARHFCDTGYQLSSSTTTRTCQSNRMWSGSSLICNPVSCGSPPTVPNRVITSSTGTTFGETTIYTCSTGYQRLGPATISCQASGSWSAAPVCRAICSNLSVLVNGIIVYNPTSTPRLQGAMARHFCDTGYQLSSSTTTRTCQSNRMWSGSSLICNPVSCGSPPTVPNRVITSFTGTTFGETTIYTCSTGYQRLGPATISCQASGSWSTAPVCRAICPDLPLLVNGIIVYNPTSTPRLQGAMATHSCTTTGYQLSSSTTTSTCQSNRMWSEPSLTCQIVDCNNPPMISNGMRQFSATTFGETATYMCNGIFVLSGSSTVTCMASGLWSTHPICSPVCEDLPPLANGVISYSTMLSPKPDGTVATYTCGIGYDIFGPRTRTCQSDTTWTGGGDIVCQASCPALTLLNGDMITYNMNTSPIPVDTVATHTCSATFVLSGDATRTCTNSASGGIWSGSMLTCSGTCEDLPNITNGAIAYIYSSASPRTNGSTAIYSCGMMLMVMGSSIRTCQSDRSWSGDEPFCQRVFLQHEGSTIAEASFQVQLDTIGEGERGLVCRTDHQQCCNNTSNATWLTPNGTTVSSTRGNSDFYTDTGVGFIRLNLIRNVTTATGEYCCQVPVEGGTIERFCAELFLPAPQVSASLSIAAVAGGIVGAIVVVILVILVIIFLVLFLRRSRKKQYELAAKNSGLSTVYTKHSDASDGGVAIISKNQEPTITGFPSESRANEGEEVVIKPKVGGHPPPSLTWYHDGREVTADYATELDQDGGLSFPSVEAKHAGVYKLVASGPSGTAEKELQLIVVSEGGKEEVTDEVDLTPIPVDGFGAYVTEQHANGNKKFASNYLGLGGKESERSTAIAKQHKDENRFGNILVYDDNLIILDPIPGQEDCQSDYINACYVDGFVKRNKFIASQGPLPNTLMDFWRMMWQERPPIIVMLTNVMEKNKIKCQQYWPDSGSVSYGPFTVTITDQQVLADYTVRNLQLAIKGESGKPFKTTQFHFTTWPDHGVPDYATPILGFHRRVKSQHKPSRGPLLVHCSAGVGRTGTYIAIDNVLDQIATEGIVDISGTIVKSRNQRMKMVQTRDQYVFIHDAILESVTCGDTQICAADLRRQIQKMSLVAPGKTTSEFQYQFQILEQVSPNPNEVNCSSALRHKNLNRGIQYLPIENHRVFLKGQDPGRDYINAVFVNGYKHQKAYIIAQNPLDSTVRNFWKMIYDRKCAAVVMLTPLSENGKEACSQYWPESGNVTSFGEFTIDNLGEEVNTGFVMRQLSVLNKKTKKPLQIIQIQILDWKSTGACANFKIITDVNEEVVKVQRRTGNKAIVVHCSDTATRSGMYCSVATTIDRCKTEGVVDVFQVVKALRVHKPGAVPSVDNYKDVFEALLVYLDSFDTYANFL